MKTSRAGRVLALVVAVAGGVMKVRGQTAPATAPGRGGAATTPSAAALDRQRIMDQLHITFIASPPYNYDEAKANPYPKLPEVLVMKDGTKVTTADEWWQKRRPEIVEDFDREVYGRMPKEMPKVTWEVVSTTPGKNGEMEIVTKQLVGHVDNSGAPDISVNIQVMLTTPANAKGPVPVMMQFSGFGFGFPGGPARGARAGAGAGTQPGAATQAARGPARGAATLPAAPDWRQQMLAKGWGYALLNTGSVQADNGGGLNAGIIGLVNKGQPRKLDDWGVLKAWAWGASKALDYFETDKAVDAKQVGLEGHSRWGKATLVAMAYDPRFAIAYVSSSGEGGAKLHRRNYGEPVDTVCGVAEYHWMAGNFLKYAGHWDDLPVDSHELIAMCAPRPVLITGGTYADRGIDAKGSFLAAVGAGPVYELLGKKSLGITEMPKPDVAVIEGDVAFRQHEGGHTDALNWPTFVVFAGRYFKTP